MLLLMHSFELASRTNDASYEPLSVLLQLPALRVATAAGLTNMQTMLTKHIHAMRSFEVNGDDLPVFVTAADWSRTSGNA